MTAVYIYKSISTRHDEVKSSFTAAATVKRKSSLWSELTFGSVPRVLQSVERKSHTQTGGGELRNKNSPTLRITARLNNIPEKNINFS